MPKIDVHAESATVFTVTVSDGEDSTSHRVTVPAEFADRLRSHVQMIATVRDDCVATGPR